VAGSLAYFRVSERKVERKRVQKFGIDIRLGKRANSRSRFSGAPSASTFISGSERKVEIVPRGRVLFEIPLASAALDVRPDQRPSALGAD